MALSYMSHYLIEASQYFSPGEGELHHEMNLYVQKAWSNRNRGLPKQHQPHLELGISLLAFEIIDKSLNLRSPFGF